MTEPDTIDPIARLWQSAPQPDTDQLMHDLRRLQRVHLWHNRILIGLLCATALVLVFAEAVVRSIPLGIVTGLWIAFVAGAVWYQRARCRAADALDLDTVSLLKRMIKRAKRGLTQARRLYAGVPVAATVSWVATRLFWPGLGAAKPAAAAWLHVTYTIVCLVMLAVMIGAGLALARARRRQLRALTDRLRLFEDGV